MPTTKHHIYLVFSALVFLLPLQPARLAVAQESPTLLMESLSVAQHANPPAGTGQPSRFDVTGGRGARHCALAVGVLVGGALGFWGNPILGVTLLRFGLMASVLHCNLVATTALPEEFIV